MKIPRTKIKGKNVALLAFFAILCGVGIVVVVSSRHIETAYETKNTPSSLAHYGIGLAPALPANPLPPDGLTVHTAIKGGILALLSTEREPPKITLTTRLQHGDTLATALSRIGMDQTHLPQIITSFAQVYDARKLRPGRLLEADFTPKESRVLENIVGVRYRADSLTTVHLRREGDDWHGKLRKKPLQINPRRADGVINSSLYVSATTAGVPLSILNDLITLYSWDVDFQRDIRKGDSFRVLFEEKIARDTGDVLDYGHVLYARLTVRGEEMPIYRFTLPDGTTDYFNAEGKSARKDLMRTPINGARLSSGFGMRIHPILGYSKMHKGTDFAAPTGTPVYAGGFGIVERASWHGTYGKYIRIRHSNGYATAYAHLHGYAKGIKKGAQVYQGQTIGYVGNTGRSTGPHLHYEILKNNRQVNPARLKLPSGRHIDKKNMSAFRAQMARIDALLQYNTTVAAVAHPAS